MTMRLSAVIRTPDGLLLALRRPMPDGGRRHLLPGRGIGESDEPFDDTLRHILHRQLNAEVTIGALIHIARTGAEDEHVFVAHTGEHDTLPDFGAPAPGGCFWDGIEVTPDAIHDAAFSPKEIGSLFAGNLRHGRPPWALPDIRSRPPSRRRHGRGRPGRGR
ncbi:hypothetical protein [Actinomadura sp. 9N407]|uniref:hypothetical protein n=1 Tax=Actinomadura sp. 9N407 TaxID=3375154 RepID=UPI003793C3E6